MLVATEFLDNDQHDQIALHAATLSPVAPMCKKMPISYMERKHVSNQKETEHLNNNAFVKSLRQKPP